MFQMPKQGQQGGKGRSVLMGFVTGGPVGALTSLVGSSNPKLGTIMGAGKMFGGAGEAPSDESVGTDPATDAISRRLGGASEEMTRPGGFKPGEGESALDRRAASAQSNPIVGIHEGLEALRDPSVPDYVRQAYAEPLLKAKYSLSGRSFG